MFESLKRAIDEIFGSVIRPIKDWVLRRTWGVRLVFLILIGFAAFSYWKPQTVMGLTQQASFYWRSWRGQHDRIPLSGTAHESLAKALGRISPSVEADLSTELDESLLTPWSASQSVLALKSAGQSVPDPKAFVAFVNARRFAPDCFCWTELHEQPRSEVVSYVSGWVMAAFGSVGAPLSAADFDYVLSRQNSAGWWPMFPESGASQYASTYSTAWLALGLHKQRTAGLVPADKRAAVDGAIRRAAMWLMRTRNGARWKAHPNAPQTDTPETLSGFVLHVLHHIGSLDLTDVDRAWLDSLPKSGLEPSALDKHYMVLPYGNRSLIDHVVDVRLPWILLATADAYSSGSPGQKARTLDWIEKVLRNPDVRGADTEGVEWVRAELLLGLAEASKRANCGSCQTGQREARAGR